MLQVEEQSEPWRAMAACVDRGPELFFGSERRESDAAAEVRERDAKAICRSCDVKDECLRYALTTREKEGIWGGLTPRERTSLQRRMRQMRARASA